jgi:SAM-dependent methyltransferase
VERITGAEPYDVVGWDRHLSEYPSGWRDKDYVQLVTMFRLSTLQGNLLDVGCAVGDGFPVLQRAARGVDRFHGCDFSPEGVSNARLRFPSVRLFVHNIQTPLPGQWNTVISLQTIEHLDDPRLALQNLSSAAKDTLIVGAPYRNRRPDADHRWSFDENDFTDVFEHWVIDNGAKNIYWYRSSTALLVRSPLRARAAHLRVAARRRVLRWPWAGEALARGHSF